MVELPDDAIEALVQAAEHAYEYTPYDEMAEHAWPNVVRAVYPLIAARVRAEAVAEHRAEQRHWIEVGQQIEAEKRVAEAERDEYRRNWQEAEKRATEALAAERRRLQRVHAIMEAAIVRGGYRGDEERQVEVLRAAGSVPVATRLQPSRLGFGTDAFEVGGPLPGQPVATPTEPPHMHNWDGPCPACASVTPAEPAAEPDLLTALQRSLDEARRPVAASPVPAEQPRMCSCGRPRSECGRRQI